MIKNTKIEDDHYIDNPESIASDSLIAGAYFERDILAEALRLRSKKDVKTIVLSMKEDGMLTEGAEERVNQYLDYQRPSREEDS